MEPVTHFLTGACLGRAGFNRKTAYATLAAMLAAEAADLDIIWGFGGPVDELKHHRGITHTIWAVPVVAGLVSLHDFPKKAQTHIVGIFRKTKATGRAAPLLTFGGSNTNCGAMSCNAVGPGDFATIYSVERLWNPGINTHPIDGTGQTIARAQNPAHS